jgi:hypothetical protein
MTNLPMMTTTDWRRTRSIWLDSKMGTERLMTLVQAQTGQISHQDPFFHIFQDQNSLSRLARATGASQAVNISLAITRHAELET